MEKESKILYHYTSMATLLKILQGVEETGNLILRGTHIEYLNDSSEFSLAIDLIKEGLKEYEQNGFDSNVKNLSENLDRNRILSLANLYSPPFITCFSEKPDSLPMWNTYAEKGNGIALGIEKIELDEINKKSELYNMSWGICTYDSIKYKTFVGNKITNLIYDNIKFSEGKMSSTDLFFNLSRYLSILKHSGFDYENEIRLIKIFTHYLHQKEIRFFESGGILKPYIENIFPKTVLKEIVIGPCSDFELSKQSLQMCLNRSGYSDIKTDLNFVEIKKSEVPYRLI